MILIGTFNEEILEDSCASYLTNHMGYVFEVLYINKNIQKGSKEKVCYFYFFIKL